MTVGNRLLAWATMEKSSWELISLEQLVPRKPVNCSGTLETDVKSELPLYADNPRCDAREASWAKRMSTQVPQSSADSSTRGALGICGAGSLSQQDEPIDSTSRCPWSLMQRTLIPRIGETATSKTATRAMVQGFTNRPTIISSMYEHYRHKQRLNLPTNTPKLNSTD